MFNKIFNYLKYFDWVLFAAGALLILFGLAEIYSVALGSETASLSFFNKQVISISIGASLFFILAIFDYHNIRSSSNYLYILGGALLLAVLFFGRSIKGTTGWFDLGFFNLQPVEFAKFVLIVFLAKYFSSNSIKVSPVRHILVSGIASMIFVALIMKQPDFGSAMILFLLWAAMVMMAGFNKKYLLFIAVILSVIFVLGWAFFFKPYQKERIMTFFNPTFDPLEQGYNITQAIIAVGSGGFMGRGIGFGSQSQLKFLPEAQNDFIFAVISEELGFLGVSLVLFLFATLFYRLIKGVKNARDDFGAYYIVGLIALLFTEVFVNIGMNIGLLPVVGIALPFLSYGGSAIISTLIMVGVAESIIIRSRMKY